MKLSSISSFSFPYSRSIVKNRASVNLSGDEGCFLFGIAIHFGVIIFAIEFLHRLGSMGISILSNDVSVGIPFRPTLIVCLS